MWPFSSSSWKQVALQKQGERDRAISDASEALGTHSATDAKYLKATACEIVQRIQTGEWTASEVLEAYIRRAIYAQSLTNCLTEILFEQARKEASTLDTEYAATKTLRGPLHGIPVSFKDQFDIAGIDSSIGFTQWANKPRTADARLVQQFREAGAIIIAKTNVPQTMLAFECNNPLWGRTTNPWSDKHTSGGSSGGEAALLAMSGSTLGVGSDTGGSLRIPTAYCGIYSLKPGSGRLSPTGATSPTPGFEAIATAMGPLARSVEDVELMCRAFFGDIGPGFEPVVPLPYREITLASKLRFGYYTSDGYAKASPACKRGVLETVDALRQAGHECVEIQPTLAPESMGIFAALTSADGYDTLLSGLGPDPKDSSLFLPTLGPRVFSFVRNLAAWIVTNIVGDVLFGTTMKTLRKKSVAEFWKFTAQRDDFTRRWYQEIWQKHALDGIIAPVQAMPAIPHHASASLSPLAIATILYNVLDCPVGIVPVTKVDPAKDQLTDEWTSLRGPGAGSKLLESELYKGKKPAYDVEGSKGLPVSVQIVGKRWDEEKVIAMMHVVDKALGPRSFGPAAFL